MNINESVVLVTGANRGLGRALVRAALDGGARRVYAGARAPATLEAIAAWAPDRVVPLALDVTDPRSLAAAAARAGDVALLFNNAGVLASGGLLTSSAEAVAQEFATNALGMLAATKAFLPALARAAGAGAGRAAVVNVLSVVSLANAPALGAYSASKAAAFSLTQALRADLAAMRIRVHGVLAAGIDTDMVRAMEMQKTSPEAVAQAILEGVERDEDDIATDATSREVVALWRADPKALERRFAGAPPADGG